MLRMFYLLIFLLGKGAFSLPLLAENAGLDVSGVLTLYPDHRDTRKFYFMPNSLGLTQNKVGLPLLTLTHWGQKGAVDRAGAYLVFSLRMRSDEEQKSAIESFLASNPGTSVAVLPIKSSIVELSNSTNGKVSPLQTLFSEFNFSRRGGRPEDEIAVNAILTGIGAKVMRAQLRGQTPFKVDYCYGIEGLGPDMDAQISVRWHRVHEYFSAKMQGKIWFTRYDIQRVTEDLRQDNLVQWEVNGGNASDEEYVRSMTEKIIERLFKVDLPPVNRQSFDRFSIAPFASFASFDSKTRSKSFSGLFGWGFKSLSFSLKSIKTDELKTETWRMKRRHLIQRDFCTGLALRDLAPFYSQIVFDADEPKRGRL